jgi:hypothetical protein
LAHISHAYDLNNLILMGARLPQILKGFSERSTGQLSVITYAANTLGCVARLFTTVQEGGGSAMFRQYCISEWAGSTAAVLLMHTCLPVAAGVAAQCVLHAQLVSMHRGVAADVAAVCAYCMCCCTACACWGIVMCEDLCMLLCDAIYLLRNNYC